MSSLNVKTLSLFEKKDLSRKIKSLPAEFLRGVWEIVNNEIEVLEENTSLTFNINDLPNRKARELERYVKYRLHYIK